MAAESSKQAGKRARAGHGAAAEVRGRVQRAGERYWRQGDFADLPPAAVATALSRLARSGELQRVGKGVYYRPTETAFGPSLPATGAAAAQTLRAPLHPAGLTAANVLGLSTQNPRRPEYATPAPAPPRALGRAVVHTDRPAGRARLSSEEGAILETLRERAASSDLNPPQTTSRLLRLLDDRDRFQRLADVALNEPPRVRAMLGALGDKLSMPEAILRQLRESLNPLSRFDFGPLQTLPTAKRWQAK